MSDLIQQNGVDLLRRDLIKGIQAGIYDAHRRILPDDKLAKKYGISRMTVRKALGALIQDGWLYRRPNIGVYVAEHTGRQEPTDKHKFPFDITVLHYESNSNQYFEFLAPILRGMGDVLEKNGRYLSYAPISKNNRARIIEYAGQNHHGILLLASVQEFLPYLPERPRHFPLVTMDPGLIENCPLPHDCVAVNHKNAARKAVQHLHALGHSRIAFLGGGETALGGRERYAGFREAMDALGLEVIEEYCERACDWNAEKASEATKRLLSLALPPTAILAASDTLAFAAIRTGQAFGRKVPDHLSVIGFDDIEMASHIEPRLTTMRTPRETLGETMAMMMLRRLHDRHKPPESILLEGELIIRQSCGRLQQRPPGRPACPDTAG